jgi:hypothetical protein
LIPNSNGLVKEEVILRQQLILDKALRIIEKGNQKSLIYPIKRKYRRLSGFIRKLFRQANLKSFTPYTIPLFKDTEGVRPTSLSGQDIFAHMAAAGLPDKFYLEIGACYPMKINNTYVLEKIFSWRGVSVEIDKRLVEDFNKERKNTCVRADATKLDYAQFLAKNQFPKDVAYLSIDIDPAFQSLNVLVKIPFLDYRFAAITFEHDVYLSRGKIRSIQRDLLNSYGYELIIADVKAFGLDKYEDWWINPNLVTPDIQKNIVDFFATTD